MSLARTRRRGLGGEYWPGFVDAMATLLLVVTFLLAVFILTQYFITQESSGKDTALNRLNAEIARLTELLAMERSATQTLEDQLVALQATLSEEERERQRLEGLLGEGEDDAQAAQARIGSLTGELEEQQQLSSEALAKVELLNQQLSALRRQIAALEEALEASERRDRESQTRIADLGQRLNVALARKVQELEQYRSDFFGRLRRVLGEREEIRIVGDRFVFQAEVLFDTGSAELKPEALPQIDRLAELLVELEDEIPPELPWVMRVDGHTDSRPIASFRFPSNWELSSARAISVVRRLIDQGVRPDHLVAAGFGEFQPLDTDDSEAAFTRNRRIELKLTER